MKGPSLRAVIGRTGIGVASLTAVASVLTSCGGQAVDQAAPKSPSAEPEPSTLAEICPEVEAALPKGFIPLPTKWAEYEQRLVDLRDAGDTETENALDLLIPAVSALADDPAPGMPILDAREDLRKGLDMMATRCKAAGSSALQ